MPTTTLPKLDSLKGNTFAEGERETNIWLACNLTADLIVMIVRSISKETKGSNLRKTVACVQRVISFAQ